MRSALACGQHAEWVTDWETTFAHAEEVTYVFDPDFNKKYVIFFALPALSTTQKTKFIFLCNTLL
jgi:hypothetical protein